MKDQNVFETLRESVDNSAAWLMKAPWEDKDFYAAFLAQASYYIRHSTRLLALTSALMPLEDQTRHNLFLKHCAEEKGHEILPINDIKSIGRSFADYPEFVATKAFYQTQYYAIEHVSPYAFFGYTLFLETLACDYGPQVAAMIEKHHGRKAMTFLKVHADADIEHVRDGMNMIENLPPQHHAAIAEHVRMCAGLYDQLCRDAYQLAMNKKQQAA